MFYWSELASIKQKVMRKGLWPRVLGKVERTIIDPTIKCVKNVRSFRLTEIVATIVNKLAHVSKSRLKRIMDEVGSSLVQKLTRIAQKWSNKSAVQWAEDSGFIQYLVVTHMVSRKDFRHGYERY